MAVGIAMPVEGKSMIIEMKRDNPWYYYSSKKLIKKRKPCLTGQYVHIDGLNGCFHVYATSITDFTIVKNREEMKIPWDRFICLKGEGNSAEAQLKRGIKNTLAIINYSTLLQGLLTQELLTQLKNLRN